MGKKFLDLVNELRFKPWELTDMDDVERADFELFVSRMLSGGQISAAPEGYVKKKDGTILLNARLWIDPLDGGGEVEGVFFVRVPAGRYYQMPDDEMDLPAELFGWNPVDPPAPTGME